MQQTQQISTIAELFVVLGDLTKVMRGTKSFKMSSEFKAAFVNVADYIEANDERQAVRGGLEVLKMGRGILHAFYRNSVIDKVANGELQKLARFTLDMNERRDVRRYDQDVVAKLEKVRKALEQTVRMETGDFFAERLVAYNTMNEALETADAEQKKRNGVRKERELTARKTREKAAEEAGKLAAVAQRDALMQQRKSEAQSLIALVN